jgi:ribosomal protein L40E
MLPETGLVWTVLRAKGDLVITMRCAKCGAESPDRAKFCVECASPFTRRCPSCNAENPTTAKFCLECAKPLESIGDKSERVTDAGSAIQVNVGIADSLEGERKTVTALFADIKGSMELIEDLDPEKARAPSSTRHLN